MAALNLAAILGPTASGKSELAMRLARQFQGEIICADSRTIYRGMDIGTAKPSLADQELVPHHLLDLINPDQSYSAAEFKLAALVAIEQIRGRGHLPIIVGGSGLYAYAVLYDYQFPAGARSRERERLEQQPLAELVTELEQSDPETAAVIDLKNPRRVIRALETVGMPKTRSQLQPNTILVGLKPPADELEKRIAKRTNGMLADGLVAEVDHLIKAHRADLEVLRSPGYQEVTDHRADKNFDFELPDLIDLHTRQLAKRQLTWLKRNPDINWFEDIDQAKGFVTAKLATKRL